MFMNSARTRAGFVVYGKSWSLLVIAVCSYLHRAVYSVKCLRCYVRHFFLADLFVRKNLDCKEGMHKSRSPGRLNFARWRMALTA